MSHYFHHYKFTTSSRPLNQIENPDFTHHCQIKKLRHSKNFHKKDPDVAIHTDQNIRCHLHNVSAGYFILQLGYDTSQLISNKKHEIIYKITHQNT